MGDLPHISEVDSAEKFYRVVHEANESLRNDKVLAYLNQTGLINYNEQKQCENGHVMDLKKSKKTDGWWWRCSQKECQKTKSLRAGTFFYNNYNNTNYKIKQRMIVIIHVQSILVCVFC